MRILWLVLELKQVDEACHGKHGLQIARQSTHKDLAAFWLGILQNAEEQAQATGRNILQTCAVKDDVLSVAVVKGFHVLGGLYTCCCVKAAFKNSDQCAVFLFNCCFHCYYVFI